MMARASGRRFFIAEITSRPLPLPSRISTTANAGAAFSTCRRPSPTDSAVVTVKPRSSMARARRCRNDLSSSTIRSERSVGSELIAASLMIFPIPITTCQSRVTVPERSVIEPQFRSYRVVDGRLLLSGCRQINVWQLKSLKDQAQRIAANIAKLPELWRKAARAELAAENAEANRKARLERQE